MIKAAILGATGYTALELIQILLRHPHIQITRTTSRTEENTPLSKIHPRLIGRTDITLSKPDVQDIKSNADVVFSCLPHAASAEFVHPLIDAGTRVVDFSADYRLNDVDVYAKWYGIEHPDPNRIGNVPYGIPELFESEIAEAEVVANPGCYPTAAILPLAPLLKNGLISSRDIIVDAKSGVSGAGRTPKLSLHFPECNEGFMAYAVGQHRHTPEIQQYLSQAANTDAGVIFTPHLVPMDRGILTTNYVVPTSNHTANDCLNCLREFYADKPFVRIVDQFPSTKQVSHTNYCDIAAQDVGGRIIVLCAIDNLGKGASGAAVQNMNVMFGFDQTTAF